MGINSNASLSERHEIWFITATVAAHAQGGKEEFRQRDVRFLIELFSNWISPFFETGALNVQNTQISRYLNGLVREGLARRTTRTRSPAYRLTRVGIIELLGRAVNRTYLGERNQFFLLYYFLKNYRSRLEALVKEEGARFPYAMKLELHDLLDEKKLVKRELENAVKELQKLDHRIKVCRATADFVQDQLRLGKRDSEIIVEIEKRFPYALSSQKPLSELMGPFPKDVQAWELRYGYRRRLEDVFVALRQLLLGYIASLRTL